jgi:hypothetical protein
VVVVDQSLEPKARVRTSYSLAKIVAVMWKV